MNLGSLLATNLAILLRGLTTRRVILATLLDRPFLGRLNLATIFLILPLIKTAQLLPIIIAIMLSISTTYS